MPELIRFRVRPGYQSKELIVDICGDHRAKEFPNLGQLLEHALVSRQQRHPIFDEVKIALSTDRFFSYWMYSEGAYEIDDDIWGLFVSAKDNNFKIISDVEKALLASGLFIKEDVNFADYA